MRSKSNYNQVLGRTALVSRALGLLFLLSEIGPSLSAQIEVEPSPSPSVTATPRLKVLILGDSLSLCGFGKRLDTLFRQDHEISAVFTYMACGTIPVSWLKNGTFANAKTFCGYWSIESVVDQSKPKEFLDGYERGHVPKHYPVPKLETLLSTIQPDILVMQTGTNLLGLFRDGKTVRPGVQGPVIRHLVEPFLATATAEPSSLKRIYWVSSPISGRVTRDVQQFVFEQLQALTEARAVLIDSRDMIPYPYHSMARDREHFFGPQMDQWANTVFDVISDDINSSQVASRSKLSEHATVPVPEPTPSNEESRSTLTVKAKLVFKSKPLTTGQLLPYQESLVAFVYEVEAVISGSYTENEILVLHPAHIALKLQPLDKYSIGDSFVLHLDEVDSTPWSTIKTSDQTGRIDLVPYIRKEDEDRLPSHRG